MKSNIRCGQQTPPASTIIELRLSQPESHTAAQLDLYHLRQYGLPCRQRMIGINKPIVREVYVHNDTMVVTDTECGFT